MAKGIKTPKPAKRRKISRAARDLMRAALKRHKGNQSRAARALGLPNSAQFFRMWHGIIVETPAMKAAVIRARERARAAFLFVRPADNGNGDHAIDRVQLRVIVDQLTRLLDQ